MEGHRAVQVAIVIVSEAEYKTLDTGGSIERYRLGKLRTDDSPTTVRHESGEVHELSAFRGRENQSPEPIDAVRTVRYREEKPLEWMPGDPLPPLTGDPMTVIVTDAVFAEMPSGVWKWRITYHRTGPHRPIPDKTPGIYMAPTTGYGSRVHSIDDEASVIPDEHVEQFMADELEARREAQRAKLKQIDSLIEEIRDGEHDTTIRRTLIDIDKTADRLRAMLDEDGIEAA